VPQRQDYILRLLEELGQFLAEVARFRRAGSSDAALLTLLQAQERLFARRAEQFIALPVEQQVHLLAVDEPAANAREKCLAYATLLVEAGQTYETRVQPALALGAYRLAMQVILLAWREPPPPDDRARVAALLARIPADQLLPELKDWLIRGDGNC